DKIGLKELVASLDIHPSHAPPRDRYAALVLRCIGPSVKLQSYAYGIKTWEDNYNIDYGFGAIPYHMEASFSAIISSLLLFNLKFGRLPFHESNVISLLGRRVVPTWNDVSQNKISPKIAIFQFSAL
ncbi:hypothetical protein L9F63_014527, partial [Diploptera punctata]